MRKIILKICWWLEDMIDWATHGHANWFYPSRYFESYKEFDNVQDLIKELHDR